MCWKLRVYANWNLNNFKLDEIIQKNMMLKYEPFQQ